MTPELAGKLESDENFEKKISKLVTDYINLSKKSLHYYVSEFDYAHDVMQCYTPLTRQQLETLERGHPRRFRLPMTATQIETMATFIAGMLFGGYGPHKVEPRGPEDETSSELMNQLLRWNQEQQNGPNYLLGLLWVTNCLVYNRGIMYDTVESLSRYKMVTAEEVVPNSFIEEFDELTGITTKRPETRVISKKQKVDLGVHCSIYLISPYEALIDPILPSYRFQAGRYAGHSALIMWMDLKRRSMLDPDDVSYVSPAGVEKLKKKSSNSPASYNIKGSAAGTPTAVMSRTAYDRSLIDNGISTDKANKNDHGYVNVVELWVKLIPRDYGLSESNEVTMFQILVGNAATVLAINESPYLHDQFPYSIGEARPSSIYHYNPGYPMYLKGIQDTADYLKDKRQESIARTAGSIFLFKPEYVDWEEFTNPDKIGLGIPLKPDALKENIDDVIKQVPIKDPTENFHKEIMIYTSMAEAATAATSAMQGQSDEDTATEAVGNQQMSAGRLSSMARCLSVEALVPQTQRVVSNFQQFLDENQRLVVRLRGDTLDLRPALRSQSQVVITADAIQGSFDYVPHDGTMPGTDTKRVAAMKATLDAASKPIFAPIFDPTMEGNINLRSFFLDTSRAAGARVENYVLSKDDVQRNIQQMLEHQMMMQQMQAALAPPQPPPGAGAPPPGVGGPPPPDQFAGAPSEAMPTGVSTPVDSSGLNMPDVGGSVAPVGPNPTQPRPNQV